MKLHKVDIDHLPKEEVLAITNKGHMIDGILEYNKTLNSIVCKSWTHDLYEITFYILKSDIIKAKENQQ
jgi:hypothetical protein